jgi:hypothetical protein
VVTKGRRGDGAKETGHPRGGGHRSLASRVSSLSLV